MKIHHVGIVTQDPDSVLQALRLISPDIKLRAKFCIDQWSCGCFMYDGGIELVVPWDGKLFMWLKEQGHSSIHHIAIEVDDVKKKGDELRALGVPLVSDEPVLGVEGLMVNFVHPAYMGVMLEIVQVPK